MAHQAVETFVAETEAGPQLVQKGAVFADKHPLVQLDAGRGLLFKPLDVDGDEQAQPRKSRPRRPAAQVPAGDSGSAAGDSGAWTGDDTAGDGA
jgi:hypothetical protein